jgi:large subunit ribosomal protein L2
MTLKKYNPTTPSLRNLITIDYKREQIWKGRPLKLLTKRKLNSGGRNTNGQISSFHRGGGHVNLYRAVDFKRQLQDVLGHVIRIEYDPNRSAYLALIAFENGSLSYIIAPEGLKVNDEVLASSSNELAIHLGNSLILKNIPVGVFLHNIELLPNKGGQLARSAGTYAKIIKKERDFCVIRLNSGKQLELSNLCFASIGIVSKVNHRNIKIGKAGRSRWLNKRPTVRGVAMNPIDHPHGGGEGKTSGGRCSVTPWGIPTKGYRTKRKKKIK